MSPLLLSTTANLLPARMQMAFTLGFHIILACFGVGLPVLLLWAEWRYLRTGEQIWKTIARRWSKAFAVMFAIGAVSGTVLSFELGLLWPTFMTKFGSVIGLPFTMEGFAFFLEAIFVGIYLYGWDKLSPRLHWWTGVPIALAGFMSAAFVVTANAWMNCPQGFRLEGENVVDIDPIAAMLNPASAGQVVHMILAAYMVTGFSVAGYYAAVLLSKNIDDTKRAYARRAMNLGIWLAIIVTPLQMLSGDWAAKVVGETQPVKLAAMEASKPTKTSSVSNDNIGDNAVDGNSTSDGSRWVSTTSSDYPHWIEVDLRGYYEIEMIQFWTGYQTYSNPIESFVFQYQSAGTWKNAISETSNGSSNYIARFNKVVTNKVRLYGSKGSDKILRLFELEVYGKVFGTVGPDGFTASYPNDSTIAILWKDNDESESGFVIGRKQDEDTSFTILDTLPANTTTFLDLEFEHGNTYEYQIYAFNDDGNSPKVTAKIEIPLLTIPVAPSDLFAQVDSVTLDKISLSWMDKSDNENGFVILRKVGDAEFETLDTIARGVTEYHDATVIDGTIYGYQVFSFNSLGNSSKSATLANIPLSPPLDIKVEFSLSNPDTIFLSWKHSSEREDGFVVQRQVVDGSDFVTLDSLPAGIENYSDLTFEQGASYVYKVFAYNSNGSSSDITKSISVPITAPSTPLNLSVAQEDPTIPKVVINWIDSSDNEDGFIVERLGGTDTVFVIMDTASSNTTSYTDTSVFDGITYHYRIKSFNLGGESEYTDTIKIEVSIDVIKSASEVKYDLNLFPNPIPTSVQKLLIQGLPQEETSLTIYNAQGTFTMTLISNGEVDIRNLKPGLYFMQISGSNQTFKLVRF